MNLESTGTPSPGVPTARTPVATRPAVESPPPATPPATVQVEVGAGYAYIVQRGDYLRKLALCFYGNEIQWPLIYDGTNEMAARDASFAVVADPNLIMPGWKLWIPAQ
jgi:nucleoid-associated protein YgaU